MISGGKHMISKFTWDTSFDSRERSRDLQDRLSNWSRSKMPGDVTDVFNKLCPPGQVWSFSSVELDLGKIDFFDLESELSARLRRLLREKLSDLILTEDQSSGRVVIVDKGLSRIQLIGYFFVYGFVPWNFDAGGLSPDQLLADELRTNNQQVIAMLKDIGATRENVRKRIAWQISEANIIDIVKALEPVNHAQVINVAAEITRLQAGAAIVQAGLPAFKKSLWFWILNFLLSERGTIFNKIDFLKSNIRQMAGYYNVDYRQLLEIIEQALAGIGQQSQVQSELIVVLKAVVQEKPVAKKQAGGQEDISHLWELLEDNLRHSSEQLPKLSAAELNEFIISLARVDNARFARLISPLVRDGKLWQMVYGKLNSASLEVLFSAAISNSPISGPGITGLIDARSASEFETEYSTIKSVYPGISGEVISLLSKLSHVSGQDIDPAIFWRAGLKFLSDRRGTSLSYREFLKYITGQISGSVGLSASAFIERLVGTTVPSSLRTMPASEAYTDLIPVFAAELAANDQAFVKHRLYENLDQLVHLLTTTGNNPQFADLKALTAKYIQLCPGAAWEVFAVYPKKQPLERLLPYLLDERLENILIAHSAKEKLRAVSWLHDALAALSIDREVALIARWINDNLAAAGLHAALLRPGASETVQLQFILDRLTASLPAALFMQWKLLPGKLMVANKTAIAGIPIAFLEKLDRQYAGAGGKTIIQQADLFMQRSAGRAELAKLLSAGFHDREFKRLRRIKTRQSTAILDYLLPGSAGLMDDLLKQYTAILINEFKSLGLSRITQMLNELYWRCIVNCARESGSTASFKVSFATAVWFSFPLLDKSVLVALPGDNRSAGERRYYRLNDACTLREDRLYQLLKECLVDWPETVTVDGKQYKPGDLLLTCAETNAGRLRQMISELPGGSKHLWAFDRHISFSRFSLLIAAGSSGSLYDALTTITALYELVTEILSGEIPGTLRRLYWKHLLQTIKTNHLSPGDLRSLVQESLHTLAKQTYADSEFIISEISKRHLQLTPALRRALIAYSPAFLSIPVNNLRPGSRLIDRLARKGLMPGLCHYIVINGRIPAWFPYTPAQSTADLLNEIIQRQPTALLTVLKHELVSERQMRWLDGSVDFGILTRCIGSVEKGRQSLLGDLNLLFDALSGVGLSGIKARELQHLLFKKVIKVWGSGNWGSVSAENIWDELIWSATTRYGITGRQFLKGMETVKHRLPPSMQITLNQLKSRDKVLTAVSTKLLPVKKAGGPSHPFDGLKESIPVRNAGLVLVNGYLPMLLERLGLTQNKVFTDMAGRCRAVHYLQFFVTGLTRTAEHLLPLNKVMCGIPLDFPVEDGLDIPGGHRDIIEGLIKAMISHWSSVGDSSVNGFRGNWLVRDGLLTELDDKWELKVEKRVYDLLLGRSPFSFSIIKYPWMDKPLHVNWPY